MTPRFSDGRPVASPKIKRKNMKINRIVGTLALTGLALALTG
jgi:hypothetical protein